MNYNIYSVGKDVTDNTNKHFGIYTDCSISIKQTVNKYSNRLQYSITVPDNFPDLPDDIGYKYLPKTVIISTDKINTNENIYDDVLYFLNTLNKYLDVSFKFENADTFDYIKYSGIINGFSDRPGLIAFNYFGKKN